MGGRRRGLRRQPIATRVLVRVVSAIPGGARLDLFVDGHKLADAVEYKTITPSVEVPSGRHGFILRPAGLRTAGPLALVTQNCDRRSGPRPCCSCRICGSRLAGCTPSW
jgi:hypothetical protein